MRCQILASFVHISVVIPRVIGEANLGNQSVSTRVWYTLYKPRMTHLELNMDRWVLCDAIERQFSAEVEGKWFELACGNRTCLLVNEKPIQMTQGQSVPLKVPFWKVVSDVVSVPSPYVTHLAAGAARVEIAATRKSRTESMVRVMSRGLLRAEALLRGEGAFYRG